MNKREEKLAKERARLEAMRAYEKEYEKYGYICGIDEVGRGPLAGPVVAGAVILPKDCEILWVNDSKKLSEKKREVLYDEIMEKAVAAGIGMVSPARIDEINILQATYEAIRFRKNSITSGRLLSRRWIFFRSRLSRGMKKACRLRRQALSPR